MTLALDRSDEILESQGVYALLKRIFSENAALYARSYVIAVICLILVAATTAFSAWILKDVINEIFVNRRAELIPWICAAVFGAFTIRGVASFIQAVLLAKIGNDIVARYQKRVFGRLMDLGVNFFATSRSGELAARINGNISAIRDVLNLTITSLARDLISLLGLIGVMIVTDWFLSLVSLLIGPPLILAVVYIARRIRTVTRETVLLNARVAGTMQEVAQGITVVKAFTMEQQLSARIGWLIDEAFHRAIAEIVECDYAWRVVESARIQTDRVRYLSLPAASPMPLLAPVIRTAVGIRASFAMPVYRPEPARWRVGCAPAHLVAAAHPAYKSCQ